MIVRFLSPASPYQKGELAGFPDGQARKLIERGLAEAFRPTRPPEVDVTPAAEVEAPAAATEEEPEPASFPRPRTSGKRRSRR